MSVPVRTGRACGSHGCRWCGQKADTVVWEVRDPEAADRGDDGLGDEVMCCTCGKHQYRWGESTCARRAGEYAEKDRRWDRDVHNQMMLEVAERAWLAALIIGAFGSVLGSDAPARPEQMALPIGGAQ